MPHRKPHVPAPRVFALLLFVLLGLAPAAFAQTIPLNVPFVHQGKNGCGPASISMIEAYWNASQAPLAPSARAAVPRLPASPDEGTSLADMRRYLDSSGYHAFTLHASMSDLHQQIAKGRAPIVALELKRGAGKSLHYVVVTGIGTEEVFVNDPAKRKPGSMKRAKFAAAWTRADHWMLLGVPRREEARAGVFLNSGSLEPAE